MVSFNRVILAGNLTRDPELRFTNDGIPVCSFGLAVNRVRSKSEEVDFFDISAWRELGETIANYKKKGDPILVEGRLQYRTWEAQDPSAPRWTWSPTTCSSSAGPATRQRPARRPASAPGAATAKRWISTRKTSKISHFDTEVSRYVKGAV
jgi:single-strand DNA-binding protein